MIRALLFDFNGVLIDDEPLHFEAFARVLREEGLSLDRASYTEEFFGRDDRGALESFFARRGEALDGVREARLLARKAAYYRQVLHAGSYPLREAVVELVREAAADGRTVGVVSGAPGVELHDALGVAGLLDLLKVVIAAEDVERGKPDPAGYRLALERFNSRSPLPERLLHPHEVAAIEDSPRGLAAASAAGLVTFGLAAPGFPSDLSAADRILGEADLRLARLDALATE
jgi:HAD superfamily hydrolase (TIGR01509 family)